MDVDVWSKECEVPFLSRENGMVMLSMMIGGMLRFCFVVVVRVLMR